MAIEAEKVPIHLKMTLTIKETAEYSNIGIKKLLAVAQLPLCALCGDKAAGQAEGI